jgi:predicted DNA-binding transcriptional regulator YafY
VPWVLGWGADAMVVGPPELHDQIAQTIRTAAQRYSTAAE